MQKIAKKHLYAKFCLERSLIFNKKKSTGHAMTSTILKNYKLLNFTVKNTGTDRRLLSKALTKSSKATPREYLFNEKLHSTVTDF